MTGWESAAVAVMLIGLLVFMYFLLTAKLRAQRDIVLKGMEVVKAGIEKGIVTELDGMTFRLVDKDEDDA